MKLKFGPLAQNFLLSLRTTYLTIYSTPLFEERKLKMTQPGSLLQLLIMVNSTAIHLIKASQKPGIQQLPSTPPYKSITSKWHALSRPQV